MFTWLDCPVPLTGALARSSSLSFHQILPCNRNACHDLSLCPWLWLPWTSCTGLTWGRVRGAVLAWV